MEIIWLFRFLLWIDKRCYYYETYSLFIECFRKLFKIQWTFLSFFISSLCVLLILKIGTRLAVLLQFKNRYTWNVQQLKNSLLWNWNIEGYQKLQNMKGFEINSPNYSSLAKLESIWSKTNVFVCTITLPRHSLVSIFLSNIQISSMHWKHSNFRIGNQNWFNE